MPQQLSILVRNAMVAAIEAIVGPAPKLRFYTGPRPVDCAAVATGTLLVELTLPADWLTAPSGGSASLVGTSTGTAGAAGTAGHFRIYDSAGTTCHDQGTVTATAAAWVTGTAGILAGALRTSAGNLYQAASAGTTGANAPVHTAGTASDGTVNWTYVSAYGDLTLDNPVIAPGQTVTQTTLVFTAGNP